MVITIGRKYGSGGKEIGQRLAQRLGIPCHDADLELRGGENEQFAAIRAMAANDRQQRRYSGLRWRLAHFADPAER